MLKKQKEKGRTEFAVEKFVDAADPNACGYQQAAMEAMKVKMPIYSWRATQPGKKAGQHLYNFVFVNGSWKMAGPMKMVKPDLLEDAKMDAVASLRAKDREEFFKSGALPE
jgi:hypothetical protein